MKFVKDRKMPLINHFFVTDDSKVMHPSTWTVYEPKYDRTEMWPDRNSTWHSKHVFHTVCVVCSICILKLVTNIEPVQIKPQQFLVQQFFTGLRVRLSLVPDSGDISVSD